MYFFKALIMASMFSLSVFLSQRGTGRVERFAEWRFGGQSNILPEFVLLWFGFMERNSASFTPHQQFREVWIVMTTDAYVSH